MESDWICPYAACVHCLTSRSWGSSFLHTAVTRWFAWMNSIYCVNALRFPYLVYVNRYVGCFQVLAIMNSACKYFLQGSWCTRSRISLWVKWLGHRMCVSSTLPNTSKLFFKGVVLVYTPISSAQDPCGSIHQYLVLPNFVFLAGWLLVNDVTLWV